MVSTLDWWRRALFILQSAHCSRSKLLHVLESSETATTTEDAEALEQFDQVGRGFSEAIKKTNVGGQTWLDWISPKAIWKNMQLMTDSEVDTHHFPSYPIYQMISQHWKSFYVKTSPQLDEQWQSWLKKLARPRLTAIWLRYRQRWNRRTQNTHGEWLIALPYQQAMQGDYTLVKELQESLAIHMMSNHKT